VLPCLDACVLYLCVQLAFCTWLGVDGPVDLRGLALRSFFAMLFIGYMRPNLWAMQVLKAVCPLV
jgi:hypothetical protein